MADVMPDYRVEIQRVRSEIASLTATLERQRLEIMEMESRRARTLENIAASEAAIQEREATLAGLVEEHGPPSPKATEGKRSEVRRTTEGQGTEGK